jgi:hypothetical protein
MKRGIGRTAALGLIATGLAVPNTGCIDTIGQNILVGFGFSLGALPAQLVSDYVLGTFFPDDGTGDGTTE